MIFKALFVFQLFVVGKVNGTKAALSQLADNAVAVVYHMAFGQVLQINVAIDFVDVQQCAAAVGGGCFFCRCAGLFGFYYGRTAGGAKQGFIRYFSSTFNTVNHLAIRFVFISYGFQTGKIRKKFNGAIFCLTCSFWYYCKFSGKQMYCVIRVC